MQLIYRGTTYSYNPAHVNPRCSVQCDESPYELIYRGSTYHVDSTVATAASAKPMEFQVVYRGITYRVNRNEQGEVTAIAASANVSQPKTSPEPLMTAHPMIQ